MINRAVKILKSGGIVAFPTETVYGLGARVFDEKAIRKIFKAKGRPADNPLIVHISDLKQLEQLVAEVPSSAKRLMNKFWPGPLTLIFKKKWQVSSLVTAGLSTVAVRMPSHSTARKLIRALGEPIAAPSANVSGRPSSTDFKTVKKELKGKVDLFLKGGTSRIGLESTVVDCTRKLFRILRPGFITLEDLNQIVRVLAPRSYKLNGAAASPGLKHRHYRPSCSVSSIGSKHWTKELNQNLKKSKKIGVLACHSKIPSNPKIVYSKDFKGNLKRMARELYQSFLAAEKSGVERLLVEEIEPKGLGLAIADRVARASGVA